MNEKQFQDIFKELRISKKMSQENIAKELDVSQSLINNWETGRSTPAPEMLIYIADYFDVSIDYLVGRTNDRRWYNNKQDNTFRNLVYEKLGLVPISWQRLICNGIIHMINDAIKDNDIKYRLLDPEDPKDLEYLNKKNE